jgi:hypothetical protein
VTAAPSEQGRRLLDEALRLLDVAQATRPAGGGRDASAHAGPECRICPFCRGIAYLREVDPQAVDRLTGAVAELAGAVRDLLGAGSAAWPGTPGTPREGDGDADGGGDGEGGGEAAGPAGAGGDPFVPRVSVQQIDVTD